MSKKVLVTGGTGFLGSYILQELISKGYAVRGIRRSASSIPNWINTTILNQVEWVEGDVLDIVSLEDAMDGVDAVIHSAAVVSFNNKDKKSLYDINTEGTTNVVNVALEKNIARFVYISSVAAVGRKKNGALVNETAKWEESSVHTHYARSKYKAELQVWRGFSEGLNGVIVNPSTILGYGNWNNSSCAIFKQLHDGFSFYTEGLNGFVDVRDVTRASVLLMESAIDGERYIVNGDNWPFRKLQETIADGFGVKRPSLKAGKLLLGIAWKIAYLKSLFDGKKPLLTKESARVASSHTAFSNEKLLKAMPEFSFTPLETTIKEACNKYKH